MRRRGWPVLLRFAVGGAACWLAASSPSVAGIGAGLEALPSQLPAAVERAASQVKSYTVGQLVIEAPWTRVTPGGARVAAGYLKITNKGTEADRLTGGTLPAAAAVEVHEMAMTDGIMRMRRLEKGLEIKPGQTVELKPGGHHLMFTGLREGVKEGPPIKGTLVFEKAGSVEVEFRVAPIGARSGSGASGGHMQH